MRVLGARLRALRVDAGLTGAVLAQQAGVGQPTVWRTGGWFPAVTSSTACPELSAWMRP
ncbi:helix-turn-helix transcriptional regulator [Streptomyces sp. NPDC006290]|uniref:helix-turn-helix domain-containing protein n=1 Tax=unclassified Streptomyces TaxID=2593676 RepID=UPI0033A2D6F4